MKLNDEQRVLVEENHNLIYWYVNLKGLDLEEWYDLLAIELCKSAMKFDSSKGAISNYYKQRCDNLLKKEYRKTQAQKNKHNGMCSLDELYDQSCEIDIHEELEMKEFFDVKHGNIMKMRMEGYTHQEIADVLGVTRSHISKILKRIKEDYIDR